jgi:uncharacterized membrane protein
MNDLAKIIFLGIVVGSTLLGCGRSATSSEKTTFTHTDSLMETYLIYQDTLLHSWNLLIKDEQERLEAMEATLDHLLPISTSETVQLVGLHHRLDQLKQIKITQKTLANPYVIEEYDFACTSLVSELLSIMESNPKIVSDRKLSELLDKIKFTDQHIAIYRLGYDSVAHEFNSFVEKNKNSLKDIDHNSLEKRPVFNVK